MRKRELLFAVLLLVVLFALLMDNRNMHGVKKYDCSLSEISPDYPLEVKEACRRLRAERIK
jgi:hypothetical protein